jgi:hypothetical protein
MCIHKRVIFSSCFHYGWGPLARPCYIERAFQTGEINTGCTTMGSVVFHTVKVEGACRRCDAKASRMADVFSRLHACLDNLRGDMDKVLRAGGPTAETGDEEEEELLVAQEAVQEALLGVDAADMVGDEGQEQERSIEEQEPEPSRGNEPVAAEEQKDAGGLTGSETTAESMTDDGSSHDVSVSTA